MDNCQHDYQLETVGGVYLTGAYVCRKCSYRIGMSSQEFTEHAHYPGHYQVHGSSEPTLEERVSAAKTRYIERLHEQLRELTSEQLPCELSQEEQLKILTELMQEALREVVMACERISRDSGLTGGIAGRSGSADSMRKELQEFIRASETLLAHTPRDPLKDEECEMIEFYVVSLVAECAKSEFFGERCGSSGNGYDDLSPAKYH